jgi:penicillin amidase
VGGTGPISDSQRLRPCWWHVSPNSWRRPSSLRFLHSCREQDAGFVYDGDLDTPLRTLLTEQAPAVLPDPARFADWNTFLLYQLKQTVETLRTDYEQLGPGDLRWGMMNRVRMTHPLSEAIPGLGRWLDMRDEEASGCGQCVRVLSGSLAASQRMVVSPSHHSDAIFHMPGGQSEHPMSAHYRDQQRNWSGGLPTPLLAGRPTHNTDVAAVGSWRGVITLQFILTNKEASWDRTSRKI